MPTVYQYSASATTTTYTTTYIPDTDNTVPHFDWANWTLPKEETYKRRMSKILKKMGR